ncbi:MAG: endo-1,4-beta-xylanase [Candidatus Magasanikbacteria bacterium]
MKRILFILVSIIILIALCYGFLWFSSLRTYPVRFGISFNQGHASYLGLDWKQVYEDMLTDLEPPYIRIAAMWSEVEKAEGTYDFKDVDYMMNKAKESGTKVTLVVGQKAPRWPECHVPSWVNALSEDEYKTKLFAYISAVVDRYKNNTALELWQVENEPFIRFRFGDCKRFRNDFTHEEVNLVKRMDEVHWVMITDSGELSTWRRASKAGDLFGTTLYRIVRTPGGRIWTYDWLPAAFYQYKAKILGIRTERLYVAELQAEPWFTDTSPTDTPIAEQEETMNIARLKKHIDYVKHIGTNRAYLWGVEWWYWMKEKQNKPEYWDIVKEEILKEY